MSAQKNRYQEHFYTAQDLLQLTPCNAFRALIDNKLKQHPKWLQEQMLRLYQEPQIEALFNILAKPTTFQELARAIAITMPPNMDIITHLHHIRAESQAAMCRIEAKRYRQEAQANLSMYQKLRKNISQLLHKS